MSNLKNEGIIVNMVSTPINPTKRDIILSEIRYERKLGHWKRANDLFKHLLKLEKKRAV